MKDILLKLKNDQVISHEEAKKLCYEFSVGMKGNHNPDTIQDRKDWEIFRDDFRGKFAEIEVRNNIIKNMHENLYIKTDLDFSISPRGIWDTTDLEVGEVNSEDYYSVSIKGVKQWSSNLLIETNRFTDNGQYSYKNNNEKNIRVDSYVLVEVSINKEFGWGIYNQRKEEFLTYDKLIANRTIEGKILGGISHEEFWDIKAFAPKGIICTVANLKHIYKNRSEFNEENKETYNNLPERFNKDGKTWRKRTWNSQKICYEFINENISETPPITLQKDNYFVTSEQLKVLKEVFKKK
ncbi:hypothetical protein [Clostridium sp. B9]|uniref:hypothetical protein n=1 Tax=Clostridium sp. B9 TaxID=3423224 RepID=UPI003D2EEF10